MANILKLCYALNLETIGSEWLTAEKRSRANTKRDRQAQGINTNPDKSLNSIGPYTWIFTGRYWDDAERADKVDRRVRN